MAPLLLLLLLCPTFCLLPQESRALCALSANCNTPQCGTPALSCGSTAVQCDSSQLHVIALHLHGTTCRSIPTQIGMMTNMRYLWLSLTLESRVTIPNEMGSLTSLTSLYLQLLGSYGTLPNSFSRLTNLVGMTLYSNDITGTLPAWISTLTRLTVLQLTLNSVTESALTSLAPLNRLTYLVLTLPAGSKLIKSLPTTIQTLAFTVFRGDRTGIPPEIGSLARLTELHINSLTNDSITIVPRELGNLRLNFFQLNAPSYQDNFLPLLCNMAGLTLIYVQATLTGTLPPCILGLNNLQYLYMSGNYLSGTLPKVFSLPQISTLTLDNNQFSGPLPDFSRSLKLTQLSISQNRFEGTIPAVFLPPNIVTVQLSYNKLSGTLPNTLRQTSLTFFSIQYNNIEGFIPAIGSQSTFRYLDLSFNRFNNYNNYDTAFYGLTSIYTCYSGYYIDLSANRFPASQTWGYFMCATTSIWFPQDLDDCALNRYQCPSNSYCSDGWNPVLNYTCACYDGYKKDINGSCLDIDECNTGLWASLPSKNTSKPCPTRESCTNYPGYFDCCPSGFISNASICTDIDECTGDWKTSPSNNTRAPCLSQDVCINYPGYFYCCPSGYTSNGSTCVDIDECKTGDWKTSPSKTTRAPCVSQDACLNYPGYFDCCPSGFTNNGSLCIDIDECNSAILHNCAHSDFCVNTIGSYYCCSNGTINSNGTCVDCYTDFLSEVDKTKTTVFPSLSKYNMTFQFMNCFGSCDAGVELFTRRSLSGFCTGVTLKQEDCSYPCPNQPLTSAEAAILSFRQALLKAGFLNDLVEKIFGLNVTISQTTKRGTLTRNFTVNLDQKDCAQAPKVASLVRGLSTDILPNATNLIVTDDCPIVVSATDTTSNANNVNVTAFVVPLVVLLVLFILISLAVWKFRSSRSKAHLLPKEVAWTYLLYESSWFTRWTYSGSDKAGYYFHSFDRGTPEFDRIASIQHWKGIDIVAITLVYNRTLLDNFVGSYLIQTERALKDPKLFRKETKSVDQNDTAKHAWVLSKFKEVSKRYPWNDQSSLVPCFHGTDLVVAEKICETGFAALSSLDAGWYGKGIYFSSHAMYCTPYFASRKTPVLILSWIIPGNVYPVIECHEGPKSLIGSALKSGYQSHYIVTNAQGFSVSDSGSKTYDEIVVGQESQIVPVAILHINTDSIGELAHGWAKRA